jgi:hypothetical protein
LISSFEIKKTKWLTYFPVVVVPGIILILILIVIWLVIPSLPIRVSSDLVPTRLLIGDTALYRVRVSAPPGYDVDISFNTKLPEGVETKDPIQVKTNQFPRFREEIKVPLRFYRTGKTQIPGAVIKYRISSDSKWIQIELPLETVFVERMTDDSILDSGRVRISSSLSYRNLPMEKNADPQDNRYLDAPIRLPVHDEMRMMFPKTLKNRVFAATYVVAGSLVLLICLVFFGILIWYLRLPPPPSAYQTAIDSLSSLQKMKGNGPHSHRVFYSKLDETLRKYLRTRFGLSKSAKTALEVISWIKVTESIPKNSKSFLMNRISLCDRNKYCADNELLSVDQISLSEDMDFVIRTSPEQEKEGSA